MEGGKSAWKREKCSEKCSDKCKGGNPVGKVTRQDSEQTEVRKCFGIDWVERFKSRPHFYSQKTKRQGLQQLLRSLQLHRLAMRALARRTPPPTRTIHLSQAPARTRTIHAAVVKPGLNPPPQGLPHSVASLHGTLTRHVAPHLRGTLTPSRGTLTSSRRRTARRHPHRRRVCQTWRGRRSMPAPGSGPGSGQKGSV